MLMRPGQYQILHLMAMLPWSDPQPLFELILSRLPGAQIDVGDVYGDATFHYARMARRPRNVTALLGLGASSSRVNSLSLTPL